MRQRDERCVVTRLAAPGFTTLEATHVFPLAQQNTWRQRGFGSRWITDTTPTRKIGADRIYSPQNGLLLTSTVHGLFDRYFFAINPRVRGRDRTQRFREALLLTASRKTTK